MANDTDPLDMLVDEFLDMWQDNIRAWAVDRELLTPADMLVLLRDSATDAQQICDTADGLSPAPETGPEGAE